MDNALYSTFSHNGECEESVNYNSNLYNACQDVDGQINKNRLEDGDHERDLTETGNIKLVVLRPTCECNPLKNNSKACGVTTNHEDDSMYRSSSVVSFESCSGRHR